MNPPLTKPSLEGLSLKVLRSLAAARDIPTEDQSRQELIVELLRWAALQRAL